MIASSSWGVLVAQHPQKVGAVGIALQDLSIDHYIPIEEKTHIINGRRVDRRTPVLGEYVLVAITGKWRETLRIRGVSGMLMDCDDYPAQVLPHEMERLRAFYGNGIYRKPEKIIKSGFTYGEKVTPKSGPFALHTGKYDGKTRRGDAAVFLLFGREQRVTFKQGELIAA